MPTGKNETKRVKNGKKPKPWTYYHSPLESYFLLDWFKEIKSYLRSRYPPIVNRLKNTFRYVDLHPDNCSVFSYEFASLLRDIGGTFSSVLDCMVKGNGKIPKEKQLNIDKYKEFLNDEIKDLDKVGVILHVDFDERILIPFEGINSEKFNPAWWDAYNAVKHTDIYSIQKGCLSNVIYGFGALTILYDATFPLTEEGWVEETQEIVSFIETINELNLLKIFPIVRALPENQQSRR